MNKSEKVRNHLIENKSISTWEAIQLYKETRLGAVIFNLRDKGWNISTLEEQYTDDEGNKIKYARYILNNTP